MPDRITVRMTGDMIATIDEWIAKQSNFTTRQEAVRQLVAQAPEQQAPRSQRNFAKVGGKQVRKTSNALPSGGRR